MMSNPATSPRNRKSLIAQARVTSAIGNRYNPIRTLTPELLGSQIDQYLTGRLRSLALVMDAVEMRDPLVKTVVAKRKKAVARLPWEILTVEDADEAKAEAHRETLLRFWNTVRATDVLTQDQSGGLSLLIRQMMDAQAKGFAVHEMVFKPGANLSAEFRFAPLWWFEGLTGRLRYLDSDAAYEGQTLDPEGWLVSVGDGLMIPTVIAYVFKLYPLRDWLSFCEKFGLPGVLGSVDGQPGSEQWTAMETAVASVVNDWAAVKGMNDKIELLTAGSGQNLPFLPLVEYMDRKIASLWRGADLSTISQGGDSAGASLQGDETDMLLEDDAAWVQETLHERVSKLVIRYQHGDDEPLAYLALTTPKRRQVDADDKAIRLCLDAGIPLGVDATREKLGLPKPDDADEVLTAPSPIPDAQSPAMPQDDPDHPEGVQIANGGVSPQLKGVNGQRIDLAKATRQFGMSVAADLAPLRRRLASIERISDPEILRARLESLIAEWEALAGDITADPEAAQAMARIQGAAMANGLAARATRQ